MKRAILPTLMGMLCLIALSGCDLFKSEETKEYEVKYRVYGTCDSAVQVIYKDETGTDITIDLENPPWEYTFTAETGTPTYIKARKLTSGIRPKKAPTMPTSIF